MKRLFLSVAFAAVALTARADLEFTGILATARETLFSLRDTTTARSDWVALRGGFAGFVVSHYDPATDTLTLTRDAQTLRIRLKDDAKVKSARFELTGAISFGAGKKIEISRATLLFDLENVFPLADGIVYRITPKRRPDGNHLYQIVIEQRGADGRVDRLAAPGVVTLPHAPFEIRVGDYGFSFTPKSH
jgi:hypothetical protein